MYHSAFFPSEFDWEIFYTSLLEEIAQECVVSSRGIRKQRAVKRKMSNWGIKNPKIKSERIEFCKYIEMLK